MGADIRSSMTQIIQNVLDVPTQALKIINADPGAGGATEATADAILTEAEDINDSLNAIEAVAVVVDHGVTTGAQRVAAQLGVGGVAVSDTVLVPTKSGLALPIHDAFAFTPAATTDTLTYYVGGLAGTQVGTMVITYVDSTKEVVQSVVRT